MGAGGDAVDEGSVLLNLLDGDSWTLKDAFEGTQIFGATGSGKTSGSGRTLAIQLLKAGLGGLVLTAKADEKDEWIGYAKAAGREPSDVLVFRPGGEFSFGFFQYERQIAEAEGLPVTEPVVNLFSILLEVSNRKGGNGDKEAYWLLAVRQFVRNAVEMLLFADLPLSFENLYAVITSAPVSQEGAQAVAAAAAGEMKPDGLFAECVVAMTAQKGDEHAEAVKRIVLAFWLHEYVNLAPETRSSITSYFTTIADVFTRGILRPLFAPAQGSVQSFDPELCRIGKIMIFDLPVKRYFETGQFAQVLYKYIWQRAAERQAASARHTRPMFLWADEAQFFVNSYDMLFQSTARSARVATFYLTQNISNYYAIMPGNRGQAESDSLLGNFNTKIFHANSDAVTNKWAAELIGMDWILRESVASAVNTAVNDPAARNLFSPMEMLRGSARNRGSTVTRTRNTQFSYQVAPLEFNRLLKGGIHKDKNRHGKVEAIFTQGGRVLKNGKIFQKLNFIQNLK